MTARAWSRLAARLPWAREAQRLTHRVQGDVAWVMARRLADIPERRIDELMVTPLRRVVLDAIFWGLPHVLSGSHAHRLTRSVRFHLTDSADGAESYWIEYREGRWHSGRGRREEAKLTIAVGGPGLIALACGRANPVREYARGRLRVNGNPIAAARLLAVVRDRLVPGPSIPPPPSGAVTSAPAAAASLPAAATSAHGASPATFVAAAPGRNGWERMADQRLGRARERWARARNRVSRA